MGHSDSDSIERSRARLTGPLEQRLSILRSLVRLTATTSPFVGRVASPAGVLAPRRRRRQSRCSTHRPRWAESRGGERYGDVVDVLRLRCIAPVEDVYRADPHCCRDRDRPRFLDARRTAALPDTRNQDRDGTPAHTFRSAAVSGPHAFRGPGASGAQDPVRCLRDHGRRPRRKRPRTLHAVGHVGRGVLGPAIAGRFVVHGSRHRPLVRASMALECVVVPADFPAIDGGLGCPAGSRSWTFATLGGRLEINAVFDNDDRFQIAISDRWSVPYLCHVPYERSLRSAAIGMRRRHDPARGALRGRSEPPGQAAETAPEARIR